jgi:prevent-host-death family protein
MEQIRSFDARTHFSDLLRRVNNGEEFLITVRGKPVAQMTQARVVGSHGDVNAVVERLRRFRGEIAKAGPILKDGETWNDFARAGMKW